MLKCQHTLIKKHLKTIDRFGPPGVGHGQKFRLRRIIDQVIDRHVRMQKLFIDQRRVRGLHADGRSVDQKIRELYIQVINAVHNFDTGRIHALGKIMKKFPGPAAVHIEHLDRLCPFRQKAKNTDESARSAPRPQDRDTLVLGIKALFFQMGQKPRAVRIMADKLALG